MKNRYSLVFLAFLVVALVFIRSNFKSELPNPTIVKYSQLPQAVQNLFKDRNGFQKFSTDSENDDAYVLESLDKYKVEVKTTGPWTNYYVLENMTHKKKYKIPYGKPFPFVVFKNDLYIATDFNVSGLDEAASIKYEKYRLSY